MRCLIQNNKLVVFNVAFLLGDSIRLLVIDEEAEIDYELFAPVELDLRPRCLKVSVNVAGSCACFLICGDGRSAIIDEPRERT